MCNKIFLVTKSEKVYSTSDCESEASNTKSTRIYRNCEPQHHLLQKIWLLITYSFKIFSIYGYLCEIDFK